MCAAPAKDFRVELAYEKVNSLIGKVIPVDTIKSIVTSLEMKIVDETAEGLTLDVPPYRVDVQRDCDVIEDILRIYGYNNVEIPTTLKFLPDYQGVNMINPTNCKTWLPSSWWAVVSMRF